MRKKVTEIALDFISNIKYTEFCVLTLGHVKTVMNLTEDDFFRAEISLREAINNAIIHGNKLNPQKRVYVKFKWSKQNLSLSVRDENTEKVNFDGIVSRVEHNDILAGNGRGIMIMKSYMDRVDFLPSEHGTEVIMEKSL